MGRLVGAALVGLVAASVAAVGLASATAESRPRGVLEDCSRISGFGQSLRDFTRTHSLVVGPLAVLRARPTLAYWATGQKLFVVVKGGHRVTLELPRPARTGAGLVFGSYPSGEVRLRDTRRVVTFRACGRGEYEGTPPPTGWPVSGWVGGLLARGPRCVPLRVWVDDEPRARRAVIRFGVSACD